MFLGMNDSASANPEVRAFSLGYIDGYFGEQAYRNNFLYEEDLNLYYQHGYVRGETDRVIERSISDDAWRYKKENWLNILAASDAIKGLPRRKISSEYFDIYNQKYNSTIELVQHGKNGKNKVRKK